MKKESILILSTSGIILGIISFYFSFFYKPQLLSSKMLYYFLAVIVIGIISLILGLISIFNKQKALGLLGIIISLPPLLFNLFITVFFYILKGSR